MPDQPQSPPRQTPPRQTPPRSSPPIPEDGAPDRATGRIAVPVGGPGARPANPMLEDAIVTLARRAGTHDPALAHILGHDPTGWYVDEILPVDRLMGRRLPASCWAVTVIASGQARPADNAGTPTRHTASPVRLAVGVDRDGTVAGRLTAGAVVGTHIPTSGRLLDTMRRSLRLPTPPPPEGTDRLLAVLWLAAALETVSPGTPTPGTPTPGSHEPSDLEPRCLEPSDLEPRCLEPSDLEPRCLEPGNATPGNPGSGAPLRWTDLVRRHPAVLLLTRRGEHLRLPEMERIVDVAAATLTWEVLRSAETRAGALPLCPPGTAGWMDVGMYARWVLADLPTPDSLWCRLRDQLTTQARREMLGRLASRRLIRPDLSASRLAS